MKVLITGSNGLLGQHLVKLFGEDREWEVLATSRGRNRLKNQDGYKYVEMDVNDNEQVDQVIHAYCPDAIIHTAAMTNVDACETEKAACWEANVLATENLIEPAREIGSFLILLSSDFVFDGAEGPYAEAALPFPVSFYGVSKLAAEMLLQGTGLDWAIARTVLVYGVAEDMSRSNIVLWVKNSLEQGKKIRVVDDQWRTPTLVQDLASGCKLITEKKLASHATLEDWGQKFPYQKWKSGVYNISGKDLLTPYQMALKIADHFKLDKSLIERADASTFSQAARRPAKTGFILDKAYNELGYEPHSFEEGLVVVEGSLKNV